MDERATRAVQDAGVALDAAALERLRGYRVRRSRARGVGEDCDRLLSSLKRVSAAHASIEDAWRGCAPAGVVDLAWVESFSRGRLEMGVRDAGARHVVERWLRTGGDAVIRKASGVSIATTRAAIVADGSGGVGGVGERGRSGRGR